MRVLWWAAGYPPDAGGAERVAGLVVPALRARGHEVEVLVHGAESAPRTVDGAGVPVQRLAVRPVLEARDAGALGRLVREVVDLTAGWAPDVVHAHGPHAAFVVHHMVLARLAAPPGPPPTVWTLHTHVAALLAAPDGTLARALRAADHVTAVSAPIRAELLAWDPGLAERLTLAENPRPERPGPPAPPPVEPVVLCLGRLVPVKGFDVAVRAFARLLREVPAARLLVVGDGPAGPALRALAAECGVAHRTAFAGRVPAPEVWAWYDRAAVVCMPSRHEGDPLVALEAAASARPVVGSDVPGLRAALTEGETGLLAAPGDAEALARALGAVLRSPGRAAALGAAARAAVARRPQLDAVAARYAAAYEAARRRRIAA